MCLLWKCGFCIAATEAETHNSVWGKRAAASTDVSRLKHELAFAAAPGVLVNARKKQSEASPIVVVGPPGSPEIHLTPETVAASRLRVEGALASLHAARTAVSSREASSRTLSYLGDSPPMPTPSATLQDAGPLTASVTPPTPNRTPPVQAPVSGKTRTPAPAFGGASRSSYHAGGSMPDDEGGVVAVSPRRRLLRDTP